MTDLIAQTAADLADLLADSTGTATDLLAIETATDLLADLKAAAPVLIGTTAVGCDWIRTGRAKRVVVIAADNPPQSVSCH